MFLTFLRYSFSRWASVPQGPPDFIHGVVAQFQKDSHSKKVNLSVGAYRDNNGKPVTLGTVQKAINQIVDQRLDNEYLPVEGYQSFIEGATKLAYGDELYSQNKDRIAGIQALSGTGAIRLGCEFFKRYLPKDTTLYIPNPTWPNHPTIAESTNIPYKFYRYYDPSIKGINFTNILEDINNMPKGSVLLLHACAHNPTGCDLSLDQWKQIKDLVLKRNILPFLDMAYQGFTSGNVDVDAVGVRLLAKDMQVIVAQSFAKNMGLYGQRCGNLTIPCADTAEKERVMSQLKILARPIWSSPPSHGARIASIILNNPVLYQQWLGEVKDMADRITNIQDAGSIHDWSHINKSIGMFAYSGVNGQQVNQLIEKYHIYLTQNGRISVAGINNNNIEYVANAFHEVTKNQQF